MKDPKTTKGQKTKAQILEKSIAIIQERGFAAVTLQDLCKASGVANGTFYHYFSSTTDILRELILKEVADLEAFFGRLSCNSAREKLLAVLTYMIDYYELKGRDIVANLNINAFRQGSGIVDPYLDYAEKLLIGIIRDGQESGEFLDTFDPAFHAVNIQSLILYKASKWILEFRETPLSELAMEHLEREISRMVR